MTKIAGSGSISLRHGSADPDPPQNVMNPQHCFKLQNIGFNELVQNHVAYLIMWRPVPKTQ